MKNFSIIVPVYNEEKNILFCLDSLIKQDYPKNNIEIIIINDCSTDKTVENIKNFINKHENNFKLINNKSNQGRMKSRITGAKNSKYKNLFFIDSRVTIKNNILKYLNNQNKKVIIGRTNEEKNKNIFDRFFFLIRTTYYLDYPQKNKIIKINQKNFNRSAKGTTACLIEKNIFLKAISKIKNTNKNCNDDIILFQEILNIIPFFEKHKKFEIFYKGRKNIKKVIPHTIKRGVTFIDYYYKINNIFFYLINISLLCSILLLILIFNNIFLKKILISFLLINSSIAIYLAKKTKDFFIITILLPILILSFKIGLIKGLILKLIKHNSKK